MPNDTEQVLAKQDLERSQIFIEKKRGHWVAWTAEAIKKAAKESGHGKAQIDRAEEVAERIVSMVTTCDPTYKKKYVQWALRQYIFGNIHLPEDRDRLITVIQQFEKAKTLQNADLTFKWDGEFEMKEEVTDKDGVVSEVTVQVERRDINQWTFRIIEQEMDKFHGTGVISGKEEKRRTKVEGTEPFYKDAKYEVLKIKTPEALVIYSSNTKWCVSSLQVAKGYTDRGCLYLIFKDDVKYALADNGFNHFMDVTDMPLHKASPALDLFLSMFMKTKGLSDAAVERLIQCRTQLPTEKIYPNRPPVEHPKGKKLPEHIKKAIEEQKNPTVKSKNA